MRGTWTSAWDQCLDRKVGSAVSIRCSHGMPGRQLGMWQGPQERGLGWGINLGITREGISCCRTEGESRSKRGGPGPSCDKRRKRGRRRGYEEASSR